MDEVGQIKSTNGARNRCASVACVLLRQRRPALFLTLVTMLKFSRKCIVWTLSHLAEIDLGFDPSQCFLEYLHVGNRL
jgi:hypothetical protein